MSEKIFLFDVSADIKYCSVLFNHNAELKNLAGDYLSIDKQFLFQLFDRLDPEILHIIDFSSCDSRDIAIDATVVNLLLKPKFFLVCKENIKNLIKDPKLQSLCISNGEEYLLYTCECVETDLNLVMSILQTAGEKSVEEYIFSQLLCQFFYDDIKAHPEYSYDNGNYKYIESSNIYVNKFINVKSVFLHNDYTNLVIGRMKELINRFKSNNKDDFSLLAVSNTGLVLAQILGNEMNISVESLNRIGPVYCLSNSKGKVRKLKNKNYLLISDVVCLGGEFRMTKGILDVVGASLIGGVCVVKIRDVYREGSDNELVVLAVVDDFSQKLISGEQIDYKILCDKETV